MAGKEPWNLPQLQQCRAWRDHSWGLHWQRLGFRQRHTQVSVLCNNVCWWMLVVLLIEDTETGVIEQCWSWSLRMFIWRFRCSHVGKADCMDEWIENNNPSSYRQLRCKGDTFETGRGKGSTPFVSYTLASELDQQWTGETQYSSRRLEPCRHWDETSPMQQIEIPHECAWNVQLGHRDGWRSRRPWKRIPQETTHSFCLKRLGPTELEGMQRGRAWVFKWFLWCDGFLHCFLDFCVCLHGYGCVESVLNLQLQLNQMQNQTRQQILTVWMTTLMLALQKCPQAPQIFQQQRGQHEHIQHSLQTAISIWWSSVVPGGEMEQKTTTVEDSMQSVWQFFMDSKLCWIVMWKVLKLEPVALWQTWLTSVMTRTHQATETSLAQQAFQILNWLTTLWGLHKQGQKPIQASVQTLVWWQMHLGEVMLGHLKIWTWPQTRAQTSIWRPDRKSSKGTWLHHRVKIQIQIYGCYCTMVRTQKANQKPTTEWKLQVTCQFLHWCSFWAMSALHLHEHFVGWDALAWG